MNRSDPLRTALGRAAAAIGVLAMVAGACASGDDETSESVATDAVETTDAPVDSTATTGAPSTEPPETAEPAETAAAETTPTAAGGTCPTPIENTVAQVPGVIADLPDDDSGYIEGVVVDASGNVFASVIRTGELLKFGPGSSEPEVFGQIPDWVDDGIGFLGLAADSEGNVYGAAASETSGGIWKFACAGGDAERIPGTEEMVFANGVSVDEKGVVWATDSASGTDGSSGLGASWRITDGVAEKHYESPLLGAADANSALPGINGIAVRDDLYYNANTARGGVSVVPLLADDAPGNPTGLATVAAPDGLTLAADGTVYVTDVALNEIVRIDPSGAVSRLAAGPEAPLACPTSLYLGTGSTERILYVANLVSLEACGGVGPDLIAIDVDTASWVDDGGVSQAVFVVGDAASPDPLDTFMRDVAGGNAVEGTFLDDEDTGSETGGQTLLAADVVVITGSVTPSNLSPDLAQLPVPLLTFSGAVAADLGLATVSGETASGEAFIVMNPDTAEHPLAAGLVGQAEVFTEPVATLNYGEVGGDAIVIATAPGSESIPVHYAYEGGTILADGMATPARRVAGYATLDGLAVPTGVSANLYFAGLDWLLGAT